MFPARTVLILAALVALATGCGTQPDGPGSRDLDPGSPFDAEGVIVDGRGNPRAGVTVAFSAGYDSVTTDADGKWTAAQFRGDVVVRPEAEGWRFAPTETTIREGEATADFTMERAEALDAKLAFVRDVDGHPEVHVMHEDGSVERVTSNAGRDGEPAVSPDGTTIAFTSTRDGRSRATYVVPIDGSSPPTLVGEDFDGDPAWSPDGTQVAVTSSDGGNGDISIMNADGSGRRNLTNTSRNGSDPVWSPDGSRLAFVAWVASASQYDIHRMAVDGTDEAALTDDAAYELGLDWSGSEGELVYGAFSATGNRVRSLDPAGGSVRAVTDVEAGAPSWSPSGSRIAYVNLDDDEIHVMRPDGSQDERVTFGGGTAPDW